ncbi:histone deacetylase superfamily [Rippkaea orientalis PCC 8801]|uniref:Histone deacetylase superfamily n=1 Tax=Rippkaea orientalis (strain PCC 8801 / RF-1) TaxID=41431 RepID=B7K1H3_RIPO1|nr:histone deacetylase [Rippkaea orientalis]ACK67515.1 histone deacetylase superfamily [Rippkaea orientalis PCC 8801]
MNPPIVYHPQYVAPIPDEHRFPMLKFRLLYELLLSDSIAEPKNIYTPEFPELGLIELVHTAEYINAYCQGTLDVKSQRRIGLPWSQELVQRTLIAVGGTILTAKLALQYGLASNTAGGTHHAFPNYGSGFCIFNDLAIASRVLQQLGLVKKVLIVDLDVHQGDGTAVIFENDPTVFTFSLHCESNFPAKKQQSDLDVPLPEGLDDDGYLQILAQYLPDLLSHVKPDLVLYDAGVDTHVSDRLGKLALTDRGLYRREMQVLSTCVAAGYPVASVIGGGYTKDLKKLVYRHSLLHRASRDVYQQYRP